MRRVEGPPPADSGELREERAAGNHELRNGVGQADAAHGEPGGEIIDERGRGRFRACACGAVRRI